jgi:serine/threonine protein kinase
MSISMSSEAAREQRLNAILVPLVKALEQGQAPARQQLLAEHPEFAAELEEFLAARDCLRRLTAREPGPRKPPIPAGDLGMLGDFRLLREIGRGGMGIVYEAQQVSLGRRVALKVLPAAAALDARQQQRFKNEAHAAALLHHPHIVPIYAVGCEGSIHYYAMQLIEGQSLAAMIRGLRQPPVSQVSSTPTLAQRPVPVRPQDSASFPQAIPLSAPTAEASGGAGSTLSPKPADTARAGWKVSYFRRVAELGAKTAEALEHAHQMGVVHRDIKPANILLDRKGHLWITDFGVAMLHNQGELTRTGELVGTLRYMSPEQAGAQRGLVDHRTDVYSLGATLYELLTLEPPFPGDDPHQLLRQIASEEPRPLRSLERAIPPELEVIVLKALAKSPAERYTSAGELADDLQRFLGDRPILARRPTLLDRAMKWSRRHKTAVVLGLALLLLATVGLLISTVLIARSHGEARAAYERERQKAEEALQQRSRAEGNLLQARQVVDFLTQLSAEELGDKPELLPLRQKMLAGALRYYQQFIDQNQGDPSVRADLDASRARVTRILSALSAQQEYLQLMLRAMLVEERDVQRDLRLTPSQEEQIAGLSERLTDQRHEAFQTSPALSEQDRAKKLKEMATANEKTMAAILTPEQDRRLKQIALQQRSPQVFAVSEVAESLRLTPEQQARIRTLINEAERTQKEVFRPGLLPHEVDQKVHQIAQDAEQAILTLLTPAQQARWREMTGEVFRGRIHFSPHGDRAPPGPELRPPLPPGPPLPPPPRPDRF